jgi:hypothetical protein
MPTKKSSTKSKKGSQPQQQAQFASGLTLGPPFAGSAPYNQIWAWGKYPPYDGRVTPCPGFWGYVKRFPTVGGIICQLGAEIGTGNVPCTLYSYYQYMFTPGLAGEHIIVLTMNLGPVTRRPRYGVVQIYGVLQIMGPGGHWADVCHDLPSNTSVTLLIRPQMQLGGVYTLRFGVAPNVLNAGPQYPGYGEAILNSAVLTQYQPFGVKAEAIPSAVMTQGNALLKSVLKGGGEQEAQPISLEEASGLGVGYSS